MSHAVIPSLLESHAKFGYSVPYGTSAFILAVAEAMPDLSIENMCTRAIVVNTHTHHCNTRFGL